MYQTKGIIFGPGGHSALLQFVLSDCRGAL